MRVLILIGGHLCTAPRPQKEADALARLGAEVQVRGVRIDDGLAAMDRALASRFSFDYLNPTGSVGRGLARLRRGAARRFRRLGLPERFGLCPREMLRVARELRPQLVIAHSEAALWAADRLADEGFPVGVDLEDWFSEDLLPAARASRPVKDLARLEGSLLRRGVYRLTTSRALAAALAERHGVAPPTVVRNVFPLGAEPTIARSGPVRLHWFSQTIGPGRGLELLFEALRLLSAPVEVHLRGTLYARYRGWIDSQIPPAWRDRVHLHAPVPNADLHSAISQHDIGLALESSLIPSRDLTITNKLFQYLTAGLAVIATKTAGQREAMEEAPGAGVLIDETPNALAAAIEQLASDNDLLLSMRRTAREAARERHCWEREEPTLLEEFHRATGA
ncbi:glycosyltransferase [bacterium]|nr:glycosyltransferase [bacterium]